MRNKMQYVSRKNQLLRKPLKYFFTNRKIKDRLFCYIFEKDRQALLQLYNVLNNTDYRDEQVLQIVTLDNVVYMSMNNDVAFVLMGSLNLYEHQSTVCANLPLRFLIYIAAELEAFVARGGTNVYGRELIKLPAPHCIVFYNGEQEVQDEQFLRLTDAFVDGHNNGQKSCLELTVRVLNINYGHNNDLMEGCGRLREYSLFVAKIREFRAAGFSSDEAVDAAVEFCVGHDVMADILGPFQAEVKKMLLTEYNEKKTMKLLRKEAKEEGYKEGIRLGMAEGRAKGREEGRAEGRAEGREVGKAEGKAEAVMQLLEELGVVPPEMYERIMQEKDMDVLERWLALAARAESIHQFRENI